jgi:hypothetical protein
MKTLKSELMSLNFWLSSIVAFVFSILFFVGSGYVVLYTVSNPWWIKVIMIPVWGGLVYMLFKVVEYLLRKYVK